MYKRPERQVIIQYHYLVDPETASSGIDAFPDKNLFLPINVTICHSNSNLKFSSSSGSTTWYEGL
ncbi:MAG: hypothetical protein GX428_08195 [Candidatus Atribacteria bacterium]|nr:hypothetical protein [Candidatus Atribacteria bacterium]